MTVSCHLPSGASEVIVSGFRFEPQAFDSFMRSVELKYTLSRPATTTIQIVSASSSDSSGMVLTLFEDLHESAGSHAHAWLGDNEEGYFAPAGHYIGVLTVEGERVEAMVQVYHR